MSMLDSLLRYIDDPVQYRRRQEELRRKREAVPPEIDEDDLDIPELPRERSVPDRQCRICQHRGPERYCPSCLAETMDPAPPPRK
jgi:hypothetical protein